MPGFARTLLFAALAAGAASPCRAAAPEPVPVSASPVDADRLPPHPARIGNVTVLPDITYATVPGYRPMLLDLYLSAEKGLKPLVIFVHGGSWTVGSKRVTGHYDDFPGLLASLAARGFAVASIDYRLSGEAKFPAALHDLKSAIRFLRANAATYGIDPDRVALWGASSGAHLAALAALTGDDPKFEPAGRNNPVESDRVQALAGWYGPYDLAPMFRQAASPAHQAGKDKPAATAEATGPLDFFGCTAAGCPPGTIEQASPVTYIDPNDPPVLLIHGTADTAVSPEQSVTFNDRLKAAGVQSELLLIDWAAHTWTGPDPAETAAASRQAAAATFDWLEKTMLKKAGK